MVEDGGDPYSTPRSHEVYSASRESNGSPQPPSFLDLCRLVQRIADPALQRQVARDWKSGLLHDRPPVKTGDPHGRRRGASWIFMCCDPKGMNGLSSTYRTNST